MTTENTADTIVIDKTGAHAETGGVAPSATVDDAPAPGRRASLTELRPVSNVASWVMLLCGVLGMAASATLTIERIDLLINPANTPSCNINPILSCGSVMVTEQARYFGFPNPLLGLPAFAIIITTAVLSVGRAQLPRWYWIGQTLGLTLGFVFVNYLAFQSVYRIGALCPYCMVVWTITPILLLLSLSRAMSDSVTSRTVRDCGWIVLAVWYIVVITCIGEQFWYYWRTLF
ncbi:MAG: vitamin K epoxide reductase family protein [Gordonia sp. (in: high G+C Gram-positive bacteria)]